MLVSLGIIPSLYTSRNRRRLGFHSWATLSTSENRSAVFSVSPAVSPVILLCSALMIYLPSWEVFPFLQSCLRWFKCQTLYPNIDGPYGNSLDFLFHFARGIALQEKESLKNFSIIFVFSKLFSHIFGFHSKQNTCGDSTFGTCERTDDGFN